MFEKRDLYRAIATLAYAIAAADGQLQDEERKAFVKIIAEELDEEEAWSAESRYEVLEDQVHPSVQQAYKAAMFEIKQSNRYFTKEMRQKCVRVLQRVADAYKGTDTGEGAVIQQFLHDTEKLVHS